MKTFKLTILFIAFIAIGHTQNLVPNPSFEDTLSCPYGPYTMNALDHWFRAAGTPDYFNICAIDPWISVPGNSKGYQFPATGNAYMGTQTYATAGINAREYFGVQLNSPLTINANYYVSFKAVRGVSGLTGDCAGNNLGVFFSNVLYDGVNNILQVNNASQVYSSQVLVDTLNWTSLNFTFMPDSNYNYMYIGNFMHDSLATIQLFTASCFGFYFIDDVYVSIDSLTSVNTQHGQLEFSIFPNPAQDIVTVENLQHRSVEVEIYNYLGVLLKKVDSTNDDKIILDITDLSPSLYFINLQTDNNVKIVRKITKL